MVVKRIQVRNFRSLRDAVLECENLTALVGRNGAGKSSFLHALGAFYDVAAPITEEDFFSRDTSVPIEIAVTYGDLREDELTEFQTYLEGTELLVTKRITMEGRGVQQRYYAAAMQIPAFAEIRNLPAKSARMKAWRDLVQKGSLPGLAGTARSADDVERLMAEYEEANPNLKERVEREEQFFGPPNVGGGKLDNHTKFVLVPAVREASEEATAKKGAVHQLLEMIVYRKVNAREDVKKLKADFEQQVREVYSSDNLTELREMGESISATLSEFAPGSGLDLTWGEVQPPEVQLPAPRAALIEDSFEGDIDRKGHGLQRALILTLLQHLAMTVTEPEAGQGPGMDADPGAQVQNLPSAGGPDLILAIEEPELYLHPSRCRYLAQLLLKIAQEPDMGLGANNQIVYTTHSPFFVDLDRFEQVRLVMKRAPDAGQIPETTVIGFSIDQALAELERIDDVGTNTYSREGFLARARPVMNAIVNEGFFADVVVVVEGWSDVGALWEMQELLAKDWPRLGIVVVPAGGKNNLDRPTVVFRGFSIPTYFMWDSDADVTGDDKKAAATRNIQLLRMAHAQHEPFPDTCVCDTWAVLDCSLEHVIEKAVGSDVYRKYRAQAAVELGYLKVHRVTKNTDGVARLVDLLYEHGHKVPVLEEIVASITCLHPEATGN